MKYSLGDKIRILRTMKGYSQQGLAKTIGLKQENISYLEKNKSKKEVKYEVLLRIASAFNMHPTDLENFLSEKLGDNSFSEYTKEDVFVKSIDRIILLHRETIETLQELNNSYKGNFKAS